MLSATLFRIAIFSLVAVSRGSDITTFRDANCQQSIRNLNAVNGYPDGVCTRLDLGTDTFQIAKLDEGCAVTLYGPDTSSLSCSSDLKIVADLATCYNASWAYYSIDGCSPPSSSSIVLPTVTPGASSSAKPSDTSPPMPNSNRTGIIVGGIVGGVAGFALVFSFALFYYRRRYRKPLPPPPSYEMANDRARTELSYPEKSHQMELYAHDAAVEIGSNSAQGPPAELPGDATVGQNEKVSDPALKVDAER